MRILWYGNPPDAASGYGVQARLFGPRLQALGHEVAFAANTRVNLPRAQWRSDLFDEDGTGQPPFTVYSEGIIDHGVDSLRWHYQDWQADLLLMLTDAWQITPGTVEGCRVATWLPIDAHKVGVRDRQFLDATGATPIAMSRHGQRCLADMGKPAPFIPHGLDTSVFHAGHDRAAIRDRMGIGPKTFAVGVNAQNVRRKALVQAVDGFAAFHVKHPDSVLFLHSTIQRADPGSPYLPAVIEELGIKGAVRWANHYALVTCQQTDEEMAEWHTAMDVLLNPSMGEGFGIPIIQSLACGTPVIAGRNSAQAELVGYDTGWLVGGVRDWNDGHQAWWVLPDPEEITKCLGLALDKAGGKRLACARAGALFDADVITERDWKPFLEGLDK